MHALDEAWERLKQDFDARCAQVARAARCQVTNELNQSLRRLGHYENEAQWISAVLDAAARFVREIAIFSLNNGTLTLRGEHKLKLEEKLSFAVSSAAAFAHAIQSKDLVIALRKPSEVSEALSVGDGDERAHIIPISNGDRVVAILFAADREYMDVNALELIAGVASAVLERRSNTTLHAQIAAPPPAPPSAPPVKEPEKPNLPPWAALTEKDRSLHLRAQRFSRVEVAQMQLSQPDACRAGREQANLYMLLKKEIDAARDQYRKQFLTIESMVDYLHLELVRSLCEGDERKLGAEYPGQLV